MSKCAGSFVIQRRAKERDRVREGEKDKHRKTINACEHVIEMQNWANIFCASARHTTWKVFIDLKRGAIAAHGQRAWEKRKARVFAEEKVLRCRQVRSLNKKQQVHSYIDCVFDFWLLTHFDCIGAMRQSCIYRETLAIHENVWKHLPGMAMNCMWMCTWAECSTVADRLSKPLACGSSI